MVINSYSRKKNVLVIICLAIITLWLAINIDTLFVYTYNRIPKNHLSRNIIHAAYNNRVLRDRPDDLVGYYQFHILMVFFIDNNVSATLYESGAVARQVSEINHWFSEQTNGSILRFDTWHGKLDVTEITLPITQEDFYAYTKHRYGSIDTQFNGLIYANHAVEDWLEIINRTSRILNPGKIYLTYVNLPEAYVCGQAPISTSRVIGIYPNAKNLRDNSNCASLLNNGRSGKKDIWDHLVIHEMLHSLGFPNQCAHNYLQGENHINDPENPNDIMGTSPGLYDFEPVLDPNHDDYYLTGNECVDFSNSPFLDPLPSIIKIPDNVLANNSWRLSTNDH